MGTLGKVLLFVNLLAAAGLAYLATQDWGRRQELTALALRHHLALKGLPVEGTASVDDIPLGTEIGGGRRVDTVRRSLLVAHFQGADGGGEFGDPNPPASQISELQRVRAKLDAVLAGKGGPAERLAVLCGTFGQDASKRPVFAPGYLARLAATAGERSALVDLAATPADKQDVAAARAAELLAARFAAAEKVDAKQAEADAAAVKEQADAVRKAAADAQAAFDAFTKNPTDPAAQMAFNAANRGLRAAQQAQAERLLALGGSASRDGTDQRRRVARLLSEADPSNGGWQKRVALVVGLRTYREAVAEQVDRLRGLIQAAQAQAVADQAEFTETYLALSRQAVTREGLLAQQRLTTADLLAQRAREKEATDQRRAQYLRRQADLQAVRADVAAALAKQGEVEGELFDLQRRVGDTLRLNFDLEQKLERAEAGRPATASR